MTAATSRSATAPAIRSATAANAASTCATAARPPAVGSISVERRSRGAGAAGEGGEHVDLGGGEAEAGQLGVERGLHAGR